MVNGIDFNTQDIIWNMDIIVDDTIPIEICENGVCYSVTPNLCEISEMIRMYNSGMWYLFLIQDKI